MNKYERSLRKMPQYLQTINVCKNGRFADCPLMDKCEESGVVLCRYTNEFIDRSMSDE